LRQELPNHLSKEKFAAAVANADRKLDSANGDEAYAAIDPIAKAQRSQSVSAEDASVLQLIQRSASAIDGESDRPNAFSPRDKGFLEDCANVTLALWTESPK